MAAGEWKLLGFGEAMLRFAPVETDYPLPDKDCGTFLRSVGGDELNVCVATAVLNGTAADATAAPSWISVLPTGPLGDVIMNAGTNAGVNMDGVVQIPDADIGTFFVLPEEKRVHYQRRNSAFALQAKNLFDWKKIFTNDKKLWLHATGITPMISEQSFDAWNAMLKAAHEAKVPFSVDFNHRKQLGTLDKLWQYMTPHLVRMEVLILSLGSLIDIAQHVGGGSEVPAEGTAPSDPSWVKLMEYVRAKFSIKRLCVCFKTRDDTQLQTRWSVICTEGGNFSSQDHPVLHRPKDECGGGSAWAAGIIDWLQQNSDLNGANRHCDLFAAMCQETIGDHSHVTRTMLTSIETEFAGKPCPLPDVSGNSFAEEINDSMKKMEKAGVLAIIRAKNTEVAIERALELCSLGCRAIEVTLDTTDWRRVLKEVAAKAPKGTCVGVGTVMDDTVKDLQEIKDLGGKFALSPIDPIGFIDACHSIGLVAVPSGLSSNEMWDLHRRGARVIKMFHAGLVGPKLLKSMLGVSPLAAMNVAPSGGCSPANAEEWWDAGAFVIGMGSNLAGKDIAYQSGTPEFAKAREDWNKTGRATAEELFKKVKARFQ